MNKIIIISLPDSGFLLSYFTNNRKMEEAENIMPDDDDLSFWVDPVHLVPLDHLHVGVEPKPAAIPDSHGRF